MSASLLCRDVAWLTEEVLFRNKDVGFGGSLVQIVHYSLSLLAPHLIIAAAPSRLVFCLSKGKQGTLISSIQQNYVSKALPPLLAIYPFGSCLPPSRKDPFIVSRPSLAATLHLTLQAQIVTHTFILEAVGGE